MNIFDDVVTWATGRVGVRAYAPGLLARAGLVWGHGGAFSFGTIDMPEADEVGRQLAELGVLVVSVDYSLAPIPAGWDDDGVVRSDSSRYPTASREIAEVFRWAWSSLPVRGGWALGGASAGGNLAAGATLRLIAEGGPVPDGVVLAYPTLHAIQDPPSDELLALFELAPDAARFSDEVLAQMYENYLGHEGDADTFAVPGTARSELLAQYPSTLIVASETDDLRTSSEMFARDLAEVDVAVELVIEPGTSHGHLNERSDAASQTIQRIARWLWADDQP